MGPLGYRAFCWARVRRVPGLGEAHELCKYERPNPVHQGATGLLGENYRVACIKYAEHIEKYTFTQWECAADPQGTLEKGRTGFGHA